MAALARGVGGASHMFLLQGPRTWPCSQWPGSATAACPWPRPPGCSRPLADPPDAGQVCCAGTPEDPGHQRENQDIPSLGQRPYPWPSQRHGGPQTRGRHPAAAATGSLGPDKPPWLPELWGQGGKGCGFLCLKERSQGHSPLMLPNCSCCSGPPLLLLPQSQGHSCSPLCPDATPLGASD